MKVAVTGANGLVGRRLCDHLAARGHEVVGLSRGVLRVQARGWDYASVDLAEADRTRAALDEHRPGVIVNCASMTDVDGCEKDPSQAFEMNVCVPATLAIYATARSAHLVQVSTDYVFEGDSGPYSEEDLPNPRGVYALTKHMGEQAVRALASSWSIGRTAVVYGWPPAGRNNFGAWLVASLSAGQGVRLFADQYVSPSLALNVAKMLAELAERRLSGIWHLSGATIVNRVEFAEALCARFGFDFGLVTPTRLAEMQLASPRPTKCGLRVGKAQRELRVQPLPLPTALDLFFAEWKGV